MVKYIGVVNTNKNGGIYMDFNNNNYDYNSQNDMGTAFSSGGYEAVNPSPFVGANVADENTVLMKVFKWMAIGLGISAISALGGSILVPPQIIVMATIPLAIIELILVLVFTLRINKMSAGAAKACFIAYSVINGLTLSYIFLIYVTGSIYLTFFIAAAMFGAAALYGKVTKKDLTGMGSFLFMGLIGLIIAGIVNIFIQNSMLDFMISLVGIVIFIGLTAFDVQKIRKYSQEVGLESNEQVNKVVIYGALQLYLDFINIFLKLLRFFGRRKN